MSRALVAFCASAAPASPTLDPSAREALDAIAAELRETAELRATDPGALLNDDVCRLVSEVEEVASECGHPASLCLRAAAEIVRPLFLSGSLWDHAFRKPRGYPGDFLLIQKIYDGSIASDPLGALLDRSFLASSCARAVQNRRTVLTQLLAKYASANGSRPKRVLSLGVGPGQEVADLIARCPRLAEDRGFEVTCVDIDAGALAYVSHKLGGLTRSPIRTLRADVRRLSRLEAGAFDFVYCAGVFDYLTDPDALATIDAVWSVLAGGGTLVAGNFADRRPPEDRFSMDYVMEWPLIYRDEAAMHRLASRSRFLGAVDIIAEPLNINLFALFRK